MMMRREVRVSRPRRDRDTGVTALRWDRSRKRLKTVSRLRQSRPRLQPCSILTWLDTKQHHWHAWWCCHQTKPSNSDWQSDNECHNTWLCYTDCDINKPLYVLDTYIIIQPVYSHIMRFREEFPAINIRNFQFWTSIDKFLVLKHLLTKTC